VLCQPRRMDSTLAWQLALQALDGDMPADFPQPTAEERDQLMALIGQRERLMQQQLRLYDLGTQEIVALVETQAEFQRQHEANDVSGRYENTSVHDNAGYFQEVSQWLQQLQDLNGEQQPVSHLLPTAFEAMPVQDEQTQPAYDGVEHVQRNAPRRSPLSAPTFTPDRNGQVPNISPTGENSQPRSGRRRRHRNRPHRSAVQAEAIVAPHPSTEQVAEARRGRARLSSSQSATGGAATATQPRRAAHQQMGREFQDLANVLKLPTAARAA